MSTNSNSYAASLFGKVRNSDKGLAHDPQAYIAQSCERLVGQLGVYNVWIALTRGDHIEALASSFELGFSPLKDQMLKGWCPVCLERALASDSVVVVQNVQETCVGCPLARQYADRVGIARRIEHQGRVLGVLRASAPGYMADDPHLIRQVEEVAEELGGDLFDMHERFRMAMELQESRRQLASLMNNLPGMAYRCRNTPQWTMEFVSEGCLTLTGYTKEQLEENRSVAYGDLIHPDDRQQVIQGVNEAVANKRPFTLEYRIFTATGEERWVWERGQGIEHPGGEPQWLEGFITDITERLRLSEHILHLQKQESLAVMAGGVAHDFNNIMTAILGNAEVALHEVAPGTEPHACLEQIIKSSRQAAELCHQMLYFCGRSISTITTLELNRVIESMKPLLESVVARNVRLEFVLEPDLPEFRADAGDIRQVVLQLVLNASESYLGRDGVVRIANGADFYSGDPMNNSVNGDPPPSGWYVWVSVTDQGCGMDASTQAKMFDPFFSTKFTGRGMGLAAVRGIVHTARGKIVVTSLPGAGTVMKVLFPVSETRPSPAAQATANLAPSKPVKTILLVDDEPALLTLSAKVIRKEGCDVLTATNGLEAVEIFRRDSHRIDLVFMDLSMPEMDGVEAMRQMKQIAPQVRVALTTGYTEDEITGRVNPEDIVGILTKPFSRADILRLIGRPQ